ncbi:phosphatase PAP2 family protein [Altererythrobacter sp.]|uniref:phosphatase PAP2 family protein n=1 Tax=Altererythrobacter sp. TaxID=1872480 RepID=UPI003D01D931
MARKLWGEVPIYIFALIGTCVCIYLWHKFDVDFGVANLLVNARLFLAAGLVLGAIKLFRDLARYRPDSPIAWLRTHYCTPAAFKAFLAGMPLIVIGAAIVPAFSSLKSMIPLFTDYTWDPVLIAWDRMIFFGRDPWELLQPVLGYPAITAGLAVIYHLWLLLLYPGVFYMAFARQIDRDTRRAFFLSYIMGWSLVGGLLATMLASVGPVFAEPLLGITDFVAQTDYLRAANEQIPVMVVPVQDMLVERFMASERGLGSGITAMPSMHIAICVLYWIAMREVSPRLGRYFLAFMIVIWIGSVHLAYHYALDGLASLIAMAAIWWFAKRLFKLWDRLPMPFAQAILRTNTVPAE